MKKFLLRGSNILMGRCFATKCWKCQAERPNASEIFCPACKIIQNPHEKDNYFKVFNLNDEFNIDQKDLTSKYRNMQSLLHPDKFTNRSAEEKTISEEYSSLVNKAYNTLQLPLKRALHLLALNKESIGEDDRATDSTFLMEMMELNEEVEAAKTSEELVGLNEKNNKILTDLATEINRHFNVSDIPKAKESIIKLKYYHSLSKRINELLREQGIVY